MLADDASNAVTTIALAEEPPTSTTVPSSRRATLEFWTCRRDLHDVNSKMHKSLATKVEQLTTEYQREMSAWQARSSGTLPPAQARSAAPTIEKKRIAAVQRVVEVVEKNSGNVKDKVRLAKAVAAA